MGQETDPAAPADVTFVPQVEQYVQAMQRLTNLPPPLMVLLWPVLAPIWVTYGFGDSSAQGFGGKYQPITQLIRICIGFWCTESSQNIPNEHNLYDSWNHVKEESDAGSFTGRVFLIGTDSKVAERICNKGVSTNKELYDIRLEMWEISLESQFLIRLIHVDNSWLICCGFDGLYCRDLHLENMD